MFRIRRIYDDALPINKEAIAQIQEILKIQFYRHPEKNVNGSRSSSILKKY